jgi:pSer/pThr/pTyr-binding forkhead associated (FHA) protein
LDTKVLPSKRDGKSVKLVVSRGETTGATFPIVEGSNLIGRWDPDSGAFPEIDLEAHDPEAKISRRHAIIELIDKKLEVQDIGSLNGTFINRSPRLEHGKKYELHHGDELVVGKTFLRVEINPSSE